MLKHAPRPRPSDVQAMIAPSCLAALALACSPKPWPCGWVVKPCENTRVSCSGAMPMPLSCTSMRAVRAHPVAGRRGLGLLDQVDDDLDQPMAVELERR
jgi:hypothetical protein